MRWPVIISVAIIAVMVGLCSEAGRWSATYTAYHNEARWRLIMQHDGLSVYQNIDSPHSPLRVEKYAE